jgi:hypothetical protein
MARAPSTIRYPFCERVYVKVGVIIRVSGPNWRSVDEIKDEEAVCTGLRLAILVWGRFNTAQAIRKMEYTE